MFAFAIFDRARQCLFIARDRLGIKPLYYALLPDGQLLFGSELKVLKEHPDLPSGLNRLAIEDYFALGYIPEPKTIFNDVFKLEPRPYAVLRKRNLCATAKTVLGCTLRIPWDYD